MPIKVPNELPAKAILEGENIFIMPEKRAETQEIRPLRILLFNLMPNKIITETQLLRLLGNTPIQVEVDFLATASYMPSHTSSEHLVKFYETFEQISVRRYDCMIFTGATIEKMPYEQVEYWQELCDIMEWSKTHVYSTLHICWGAQAALYYHYNIPKYLLKEKKFGVFPHTLTKVATDKLFRGFDDIFFVPHARHTEVRQEDILRQPELKILSASEDAGVFAVSAREGRQFFIFGHAEYDALTLHEEYERDLSLGPAVKPPENYYPVGNKEKKPQMSWRSTAHLLFSNWLNYYVYQDTPYDLSTL